MRLFNIFGLHFQQVFHHRLRSLVWFLIPLLNNLILIIYWNGALHNSSSSIWNTKIATTYYFLMTIAGALLTSHIEESVAIEDILYGDLSRYLTKPFSYFWLKFIEEIPYRILQGSYGIIILILFSFFFKNFIVLSTDPLILGLTAITIIMAFFLTFTMKMNLGLSAFWFKDSRGAFELVTIVMIIFAGGIIPLYLFPLPIRMVAFSLPFAYTAYFPIIGLQGQLTAFELLRVLCIQGAWLGFFTILNRILWKNGVKKFTAFGQ